jgi:hypothetical protein
VGLRKSLEILFFSIVITVVGSFSGCDSGVHSKGPEPGIWAPGMSWQWQLEGTIDTSLAVQVYDVDLFETEQTVIDALHANGTKVICYFSAGTWEPNRPDGDQFPSGAIGNAMVDWPDEKYLDIRNATVRSIMAARMDLAKSKQCDAVEPDNVDGYAIDEDGEDDGEFTGFQLTATDQLDYNMYLSLQAHDRNLSVGLKNDVDQISELVDYFDWTLNEECFKFTECENLLPFIQKGKAVFHVEYGARAKADEICPQANTLNFDTLIKNLSLNAFRISCRDEY